jgi:hypothetical protein
MHDELLPQRVQIQLTAYQQHASHLVIVYLENPTIKTIKEETTNGDALTNWIASYISWSQVVSLDSELVAATLCL